MVSDNPYRLDDSVESGEYFGQQGVVNGVIDDIATRNEIVLVGCRKIGKTSILRRLEGEIPVKRHGYSTRFVDLDTCRHQDEISYINETLKGGVKLVLLIDNADLAASREGLGEMIDLAKKNGNLRIVWVTNKEQAREASGQLSRLFKRKLITICHLSQEGVTGSCKRPGVSWDNPPLAVLPRYSGGNPYYVKVLCHCAWDFAVKHSPRDEVVITLENLRSSLKKAIPYVADVFSQIVEDLTPDAQTALSAILRQPNIEVEATAAEQAINELKSHCLIREKQGGGFSVSSDLLHIVMVRALLSKDEAARKIEDIDALSEPIAEQQLAAVAEHAAPKSHSVTAAGSRPQVPEEETSIAHEPTASGEALGSKSVDNGASDNPPLKVEPPVLLKAQALEITIPNRMQGREDTEIKIPNLEVRRGDVIFLWGRSGVGKSTFIKLCLGIMPQGASITGTLSVGLPVVTSQATGEPVPLISGDSRGLSVDWDYFGILPGLFFGYCPQNPFARFDISERLDRQIAASKFHEKLLMLPGFSSLRYINVSEFYSRISRISTLAPNAADAYHADILEPLIASKFIDRVFDTVSEKDNFKINQEISNLGALPDQRSYGYIQKLSMLQGASSLSVLFMDEPFNGLDPVRRRQLVRYCIGLLEEGAVGALVCATHDHRVIKEFYGRARGSSLSRTGRRLRCGHLELPSGNVYHDDDRIDIEPIRGSARGVKEKQKLQFEVKVKKDSPGKTFRLLVEGDYELGSVVGIVGNSNCGKSTFGRHLCEWDVPFAEREEFLQYVPQNPFTCFSPGLPLKASLSAEELRRLDPNCDVKANLDRLVARIDQLMAEDGVGRGSGLGHLLEKPPGLLSGGELQRMRILISMAMQPEMLFLDEPFAHQDHKWRQYLFAVLEEEVSKENMRAALIVSHDIVDLRSICDNIILLADFHFHRSGIGFSPGKSLVVTLPVANVDSADVSKQQFCEKLNEGARDGRLSQLLDAETRRLGWNNLPPDSIKDQIKILQDDLEKLEQILPD